MTDSTKINQWLIALSSLNWKNKILSFTDLIPLFKDESFSTEHIFLTLYIKEYVSTYAPTVEDYKERLQSGIPAKDIPFNTIKFHLTGTAIKLIEDHQQLHPNKDQTFLDFDNL
jgi:hypothetical protein